MALLPCSLTDYMYNVDHTQSLDECCTEQLVRELLNRIEFTNGLECTETELLDDLASAIMDHIAGETAE